MRWLVLLGLVACGSKPSPPDPAAFRAMTPDQQCAATAPRGARCADELMIEDVKSLGSDPALTEAMRRAQVDIESTPRATGDEARKIHETQCAADRGYAAAVVACWNIDDCAQFAACVKHEPR